MSAPDGRTGTARRPAVVLTVLGAAFLMTVLDSTSVVAALPSIESGLGFTAGGVAWVVTAYGVAMGGLLLSAGRVADVVGARRTFLVATAAFGLTSLVCGLAPTGEVLIAGRLLQGAAAAAMTPSALALLLATYPEGSERDRAIGIWGGLGGIGATVGLLVGGLLTSLAGWEWIFFVNVPVCAAVLLTRRALPDTDREPGRRIDAPAALTLSGALAAAIFAILRGPEDGWTSPRVLGPAAVAVALVVVFRLAERRATDPVLPARLLRLRGVVVGNATVLTAGIAVDALLLLTTRYVQQVLGAGPLGFGVLACAMTVSSVAGVALGQRIVGRVGARPVAVTGMGLVAAAGLLLIGSGTTWAVPALGMVVFGVGMGFAFVAGQIACLAQVDPADVGTASGLEETSFGIGGTLGTAAGAAVGAALLAGAPPEPGLAGVLSFGYVLVAVIGVVGTLLAVALPRTAEPVV